MKTDFFFGGTTRPLMIHLDLDGPEDHTFFSLRFCDCTGLHFHTMGMHEEDVLDLRTPRELTRLSEWLGKLAKTPPVISPGEWRLASWESAGFSPEFEAQSIADYDATALSLHGIWHDAPNKGLCFHVGERDGEDISTEGIPRAHLLNFSVALWKLAHLWETKGINLNRAQPLGSTWGRARRVRKGRSA